MMPLIFSFGKDRKPEGKYVQKSSAVSDSIVLVSGLSCFLGVDCFGDIVRQVPEKSSGWKTVGTEYRV